MNYETYFSHDDPLSYRLDIGSKATRELFLPYCAGRVLEVGPGMNPISDESEKIDIADGIPIERTPFPDKTFSVILMSHVLEHVESDMLAINECYRILRPGGVLVVLSPGGDLCTMKEMRENGHIRRYNRDRVQFLESPMFPCVHFRYVHCVHNLVWNRLKFVLKALNYPFRKLDGKSIYERRLYAWMAPRLTRLLDRLDRDAKKGNAFFIMRRSVFS